MDMKIKGIEGIVSEIAKNTRTNNHTLAVITLYKKVLKDDDAVRILADIEKRNIVLGYVSEEDYQNRYKYLNAGLDKVRQLYGDVVYEKLHKAF
jgi:hypothetical protein